MVKFTGVQKETPARAGLPTRVEENVTCCYAVQDKVWTADPDGNRWEVFVVLDAEGARHQSDSGASACCPQESAARQGTRNVVAACC